MPNPAHSQRLNPLSSASLDDEYQMIEALENSPTLSQRGLANLLGFSLGKVNYCLKALIDKGFIKATHFAQNPNKLQYAYLLTPQGIASKAALATLFLERKIAQYEHLRGEIEVLKAQVASSKILDAALENDNDQAALGNFGDK